MRIRTRIRIRMRIRIRILKESDSLHRSQWPNKRQHRSNAKYESTQLDEYERKRISGRTSLKDRKRTYVRKCTSDVRNHFVKPFYTRPDILSNRIISEPNLGTFGLILRKVAFFFSCPHSGRGEHFGR